jgi:hypothetical protein
MFVYAQQNNWPCKGNGLFKSLALENNNGQHSVLGKQATVYVYTYFFMALQPLWALDSFSVS